MILLMLILLLGIGALAYYIFYKKSTGSITPQPSNSPLDVWSKAPAPSDIMTKLEEQQKNNQNNSPPETK